MIRCAHSTAPFGRGRSGPGGVHAPAAPRYVHVRLTVRPAAAQRQDVKVAGQHHIRTALRHDDRGFAAGAVLTLRYRRNHGAWLGPLAECGGIGAGCWAAGRWLVVAPGQLPRRPGRGATARSSSTSA
jgi:hypothetical protein